jgi:dihydrofolate synthase/folylpolyglutamate synthase
LRVHGPDWRVTAAAEWLVLEDGAERLELPAPTLRGVHQIENAGLAAMAARALAVPAAAIADGLRRATWAARLQKLARGPLTDRLGPAHELLLDGGHNPAAGEVLARSLPALAAGRPIHLVVGMLQTKDAASFLRPLVSLAASLTTVPVQGEPAGRAPEELAAIARGLGGAATVAPTVDAAIAAIAARQGVPALVLICGSLYLAGQVLRANG